VATVLVVEPLSQAGLDILAERHEVVYRPACGRDELLDLVRHAEAIIVRSGTQVDGEVLAAAPRLRVVGRAGVGVNNIDVEAATRRGVVALNVPDGNTVAACEQTFALMLALARNVPAAVASLRAGRWERERFVGVELRGKTLGVVGLGRIGQEVCRRATAFGMHALAHDPFVPAEVAEGLGVRLLPLPEVLAQADFLTIHTPLTAETRGLIGRRELRAMKPGAFLINCARGGLVDEAALYDALASGHLAGAGLDVFAQEPPGAHPLLGLDNVVATPHLGASTREAQEFSATLVARYVCDALAGQPVRTAVNLPALDEPAWSAVRDLLPLAELLGTLYVRAVGGPCASVEVRTGAALPGQAGDLLLRSACKGLLAGVVADPVSLVNATLIAHRRGIRTALRVEAGRDPGSLEIRCDDHVMAGAGTPAARITVWDGVPVDIAPAPFMLVTRHRDRPGLIGRVGTLLGEAGVNIAAMHVGRHSPRGEAVMVLTVDEPVPAPVVAALRADPAFDDVRFVELPGLVATRG
jgi:D-3-phosphoglycerate dehydrogenase